MQQKLSEQSIALIASRFKALSEPNRLKLLMALGKSEQSVGALVEQTGMEQANVSRHLQQLAQAGFLKRRKQGLSVYYAVADQCLFRICDLVCGSAEEQLKQQVKAFQ